MAIYDNLNIIYEDNHIIVVVKPQNIPVQGDISGDTDLLTMIKQYRADHEHKPGEVYLGLVHRLDRPTGGVMVFAKTSKAAARLCESITSGDFEKKYLTVVRGRPVERNGRLEQYLLKDERLNKVFVAPMGSVGAKKAITEYTTLDTRDDMSLLKVEILTGRGHQIRVQLASILCPIIGDRKYNEDKNAPRCNMALWAYELRFSHPVTHEKMVYRVSPDPTEFPWSKFDLTELINVF